MKGKYMISPNWTQILDNPSKEPLYIFCTARPHVLKESMVSLELLKNIVHIGTLDEVVIWKDNKVYSEDIFYTIKRFTGDIECTE